MHVGMHAQLLSHVQFFATPWTITHQTPLTMEFSRQEYGRGLPFPPPGYLPDSGIKSASPVSPALASRYDTTMPPGKPPVIVMVLSKLLRCMYLSFSEVPSHIDARLCDVSCFDQLGH